MFGVMLNKAQVGELLSFIAAQHTAHALQPFIKSVSGKNSVRFGHETHFKSVIIAFLVLSAVKVDEL